MANFLYAVIGIVFAAFLMAAGIAYIDPHAFTRRSEATNNTAQVEQLVTDYQKLHMSLGRRPVETDYQSNFPTGSQNLPYTYSQGIAYSKSAVDGASGNWQYIPSCGDGTQDCFCLTLSNPTQLAYQATQNSAKQLETGQGNSEVEFSTSKCDDSAAVTTPVSWPSVTPSAAYLTVRMYNGVQAPVASGTYTATNVTYSAPDGCGTVTGSLNSTWTCIQSSNNQQVAQSNCTNAGSAPPSTSPRVNYQFCGEYYFAATYGACVNSQEQLASWQCLNKTTGTAVAQSLCQAAGQVPGATQGCAAGTGVTYIATGGNCSNTCGAGAMVSGSWTCNGSDGSTGNPPSDCSPASQACSDYSGCTYTVVNVRYSGCQGRTCNNDSSETIYSWECLRSDGTTVDRGDPYLCQPPANQMVMSCPDSENPVCSRTPEIYTASSATYNPCQPARGGSVQTLSWFYCTRSSDDQLAHFIHGVTGIRWRVSRKTLNAFKDWVSKPSCPRKRIGPHPPCPTIRSCRLVFQPSAARRWSAPSTAGASPPMAAFCCSVLWSGDWGSRRSWHG